MTRTTLVAIALASAVALAGCSGGDTPVEHSASDRNAGHTSSSAGLPDGHVDAGEQLAHAKGKATGQSCVDCHGEEGNAPIDYIAHSLQQYRDGNREHALMSQQAKDLTDQQIADLAAYFGSRQTQLRDLHGVNK